jgi:triosephosphate isomerase
MAGRRPIVAANWKMHKTHLEAIQSVQKLSYLLDATDAERVEVVICPAFTALRSVQTLLEADRLAYVMGAQNVHWEEKGAFTGEVSPGMLVALKCKKVRAVFGSGMVPILCVGESLEDRDAGRTDEKVVGQVRAAVAGLAPGEAAALVIAYEPIWAIGTGRNASPADAGQVIGLIRETVGAAAGPDAAAGVRIQYGGSVKAANIRDFMAHPDIDGALVGGASLDPEEFALIVKYPS